MRKREAEKLRICELRIANLCRLIKDFNNRFVVRWYTWDLLYLFSWKVFSHLVVYHAGFFNCNAKITTLRVAWYT